MNTTFKITFIVLAVTLMAFGIVDGNVLDGIPCPSGC